MSPADSPSTLQALRRFLAFDDSLSRTIAISAVSGVAETAATLAIPLVVRDVFTGLDHPRRVAVWAVLVVLLYLGQAGAGLWRRVRVLDAAKRARAKLHDALFEKLYALPMGRFHDQNRGRLHDTLVQDSNR